ncbi:hypothetical protein TNCV_3364271 [Trichonephila clavipes]|nr:hypothetical protein TNCV_3364271 [Trichonephila clavipes]
MRLKKEIWLVEKQMRHVQEKHKMRMKEEQKCLPDERCKRMKVQNQLLNEEHEKLSDETYGRKEETPVDVRKDKAKGDVNPVILSRERVDLDGDEIEEEKPKLLKRKLKKLSRMIVAKLQQKVNLKA